MIDTISDMLTRIRNANLLKHTNVKIPSTKISKKIAQILQNEGFIYNIQQSETNLIIKLKYIENIPVISGIKRVSKQGLRQYFSPKKRPMYLGNFGIAVITTSQGLMTNVKACNLGIGGEILFYIW